MSVSGSLKMLVSASESRSQPMQDDPLVQTRIKGLFLGNMPFIFGKSK